jgi:hypothetical protein
VLISSQYAAAQIMAPQSGGDASVGGNEISGTANILSYNSSSSPGSLYGNNEIQPRFDIVASELVKVDLSATCSTGDAAAWTTQFVLGANKSAASVAFKSGTPSWSLVGETAGALSGSWTPGISLDTTNGAAYLTGSGTCTGSKTIYWTAKVTTVESASGAN